MKWIRDFEFIKTKVHLNINNLQPKFTEISWYINYLNLLLLLQTAYFINLFNLPELVAHLHLCNVVWVTPRGNPPCGKSLLFTLHRTNSPSGFNEDSFFYSGFSSNKPLVCGSRGRGWCRVFYNSCFHYYTLH